MENCPIHNSPFEWKEAGVSRDGKPYKGFWCCRVKDDTGFCKMKPTQPATPVAKFERELDNSNGTKYQQEKDERIVRSVALKAAIEYWAIQGSVTTPDTVLITAEIFNGWLKKN